MLHKVNLHKVCIHFLFSLYVLQVTNKTEIMIPIGAFINFLQDSTSLITNYRLTGQF